MLSHVAPTKLQSSNSAMHRYQKLKGRFRKDPPVAGFSNIIETGVPALQAHCEMLTEAGREANCRAFLNKLNQLLNSLTLWASSDRTGANLTKEQKTKEARFLSKSLEGLESVSHDSKAMYEYLQDPLFSVTSHQIPFN